MQRPYKRAGPSGGTKGKATERLATRSVGRAGGVS